MPNKSADSVNYVKRVLRQLVGQLWPDQIAAFEMTLGQLKRWPCHWERLPPEQWTAEDLLTEAVAEGFFSPGTIPAKTPPWARFAVVVTAVAEQFRGSEDTPRENDIEALYEKLGSGAKLSERVLDIGRPAVVELVRSYFLDSTTAEVSAVRYIVYEGSKKYRFSEEKKLERFRAKKLTYDIYVDDIRSEILVLRKNTNLRAGETNNFLLLKCLLRRVGDHWKHEELFEQVGIPEPTDESIKKVVQESRRALLHRRINSVRKSLSAIAGETQVNHWFKTEPPKRIVIAYDLNSCLIESIS